MHLETVMSMLEDLNCSDIPCMAESYRAIRSLVPRLFCEYRLNMPNIIWLVPKLMRLHESMDDENGYDVQANVIKDSGQFFLLLTFTCDSYNVEEPPDDPDPRFNYTPYCDYEEIEATIGKNGKPKLRVTVLVQLSRNVPKWVKEKSKNRKQTDKQKHQKPRRPDDG